MLFASATNFHRKSGGAERRDLRFYGPFVEMFFDIPAGSANLPHCHPDSSLVILDTQSNVFNPLAKPSSCLPRRAVGAKRLADPSHNEGLMARSRRNLGDVRRCYLEFQAANIKLTTSDRSEPGFPSYLPEQDCVCAFL